MILNLARFWRAQVRARRAVIIFWKSSTPQLSLEKNRSKAPLGNVLECFEGLCAYVDSTQRSTLKWFPRGNDFLPKFLKFFFLILRNQMSNQFISTIIFLNESSEYWTHSVLSPKIFGPLDLNPLY